MDYGGTAAWLISFTLYVQHKSGRHCRCPNWDSILMTVAWLCNSVHTHIVQCIHYGKCSLCCLSCVDLQYFSLHMNRSMCIKAELWGSRQMLDWLLLSWVHRGLFSVKVISGRSQMTTNFAVIAYSCVWQISEMRSSVDIWKDHKVAIWVATQGYASKFQRPQRPKSRCLHCPNWAVFWDERANCALNGLISQHNRQSFFCIKFVELMIPCWDLFWMVTLSHFHLYSEGSSSISRVCPYVCQCASSIGGQPDAENNKWNWGYS